MQDLEREFDDLMRQFMAETINAQGSEREELEKKYGQVWDTQQLQKDFHVHGFLAPFCGVTRRSDGKSGSLIFQHLPRYYWGFTEDEALSDADPS